MKNEKTYKLASEIWRTVGAQKLSLTPIVYGAKGAGAYLLMDVARNRSGVDMLEVCTEKADTFDMKVISKARVIASYKGILKDKVQKTFSRYL